MAVNRRSLLKMILAAPLALAVKRQAAHAHDFQPDRRFYGWSCDCGAIVADAHDFQPENRYEPYLYPLMAAHARQIVIVNTFRRGRAS